MRAQREVVVLVPSESCQVEDDDELDPALVDTAVLQQLLQFRAVGSLRALALFAESSEDFEALTLAVFLAGLELRRQTQILVCSFVLTRMYVTAPTICPSLDPFADARKLVALMCDTVGDRSSKNASITTCAIVSACRRI